MSKNKPTVAIIGGSLVGPTMARLLDRRGIKATIFEALARPHSQSGGVMGLRHDTLDVLASVGVSTERVKALSSEAVRSHHVLDAGRTVYRGQAMFPGTVTSWDALYGALSVDAPVKFGHRVVDMKPDGQRFVLHFSNGTAADFDRVLFADGRKSWGRDKLDPVRPLHYNGYTVWRGLAPPPSGPRPVGFERYYDYQAGRLFSVTAPLLQSNRVYWELSSNLRLEEWLKVTRGRGPTDLAYLLPTQFNDDARDVVARAAQRLPRRFREMIDRSDVSGIPVNDVEMPKRIVFSNRGGAAAVLLGDAVIPVRLQVGAGLNQGVVQAAEVADVMAESDSATALRKWQTHALDRLAPIVDAGRRRAHAINLGQYEPVRQGWTGVPEDGTPFGMPKWVMA